MNIKRRGRPPQQFQEAVAFLHKYLSREDWRVEFLRRTAECQGLCWRTVEKAKRALGITSHRVHDSFAPYWYWKFPKETK